MNELAQNIFYRLSTYTVWNDLDSQVKDLLMEAINIGVDETPEQVSVEPEVQSANSDILKTINEFFDNYFLDKDKCFYVDSLKFKNNLHFATLITRQLKIDLLSRLSV